MDHFVKLVQNLKGISSNLMTMLRIVSVGQYFIWHFEFFISIW